MEKNYDLIDGLDALREGRKAEARRLLAGVIREDPHNEDAWLGMAYAVEEEDRHIECMRRVLAINPENEQARKALAKVETAEKASIFGDKLGRYGILAIFLVVALCVPAALFSSTLRDLFSPTTPTPTRIQIEFTLTPSPVPTETPAPPTETATSSPATSTPTLPPSPTAEKQGADLFPCVPDSLPLAAQVSGVVDGDTIQVQIEGVEFQVRYLGVDAPDLEMPYGEQVAEVNRELVSDQGVLLYPDLTDRDPEGRLLRYVFVGDMFVNYELLRLGYAAAVESPPDTACGTLFQEAMRDAERESAGLWAFTNLAGPTPTPAE